MGDKKSFVWYDDFFADLDSMTPEECKEFLVALRNYREGKEVILPTDRFMLAKVRETLRIIKSNDEKYQEKCEKNKSAVNKRWHKDSAVTGAPTSVTEPPQPEEVILEVEEIRPPEEKPKRKKSSVSTEEVKELWNRICGDSFGKIQSISVVRKQKIQARATEFGEEYLDKFEEIFGRMLNAPFCLEGAKKWCNFDWIIANDNNYVKLLEGRYDHHSTDNGNRPLTKFELAQLSKQQAANAIANSCVADFERERDKESRVPIMQL